MSNMGRDITLRMRIMQVYKPPHATKQNYSVKINRPTQQQKGTGDCKRGVQVAVIRREYAEKIRAMEAKHLQEIHSIQEAGRKERQQLERKHLESIAGKDEYIRLLEYMLKREGGSRESCLGRKGQGESNYLYTEGGRTHQLVPYFDEISDRIDYKIYRNGEASSEKESTFSKTGPVRGRTLSCSSSRHKLIPKGKPGEPSCWDRIDIRFPGKQQNILKCPCHHLCS